MPAIVREKGRYELFETNHHHRILVLNNRQWFAWVRGQQGDILVLTDSDHQKARTLQQGQFYLVDFEDDPKYKDMPHLFLQDGDRYQELMLPNGLPTEQDRQKRVVKTDQTLPREKLEEYLKHPAPAGPGEARMGRPGGGSMANVVHYLKGIDFPANREEVLRYARSRGAPAAVIEQLKELEDRDFENMADLTRGIGEGKQRGGVPAAGPR
jgi:hypothetical protein